jgi:16S rRNA (cytosine967-C5)-methyltransferase
MEQDQRQKYHQAGNKKSASGNSLSDQSATGKSRSSDTTHSNSGSSQRTGGSSSSKPAANKPGISKPAAGKPRSSKPGGGKSRHAPDGPREAALEVLRRVEEEGAYSSLALGGMLSGADFSRRDAALATELVYGTIQRLNTIDYVLAGRVKGWPDKLAPWVRCLLRLSYYQLRWLDRVPPHAAVDEAVRIARKRGHAGIAGLVNGVLRSLLREGIAPEWPSHLSAAERIALEHSHPVWLVERWISAYGEKTAAAICEAGNMPPHGSARVNRLRAARDALLADMAEAGLSVKPSPLSEDGIIAYKSGSLADTSWFREGKLTVQDESSMLVAAVANPSPGMTVLDCCAAPGGKATHLAEIMRNEGKVLANDIHAHKRKLIEDQKERLGLSIIETMTCDALELSRHLPEQSMDVVLLDAPCSGFGVIRRKPEIKWNKSPQDIAGLSELQQRLLQEAGRLVKPGGTLVYSTCTIAPEENESNVLHFLKENPAFSPDLNWPEQTLRPLREKGILPEPFQGRVQILPHHFGSDGFFIARMRRNS